MSKWKDIVKLSDQEAKKREDAFEAQILAAVNKDAPQPSPPLLPPAIPIRDGIQISVTNNGHTTRYDDLETVPWPMRQRIMNVWQPPPRVADPASTPVGYHPPPPPTARKKSLRLAMTLNLLVPGLGQFYFGQPVLGSIYAIGFLACFVATLVKFMSAYSAYLQLSTSGDILETGNIEQLAHAFPTGMLTGLTIVSIVIYLASAIHLALSNRSK